MGGFFLRTAMEAPQCNHVLVANRHVCNQSQYPRQFPAGCHHPFRRRVFGLHIFDLLCIYPAIKRGRACAARALPDNRTYRGQKISPAMFNMADRFQCGDPAIGFLNYIIDRRRITQRAGEPSSCQRLMRQNFRDDPTLVSFIFTLHSAPRFTWYETASKRGLC